jgi:hypothetical protein
VLRALVGADRNWSGLPAGRGVEGDIRLGVAKAALAADPLAVTASVVVTVEIEPVTVQAQGVALGVILSFQTGEGLLVLGVVTDFDGPQGSQFVVDEPQDLVVALPSITDDLTDLKMGKTALQVLQPGDGL